MAVNIGPKIGIDGEAEYRKQINDIITSTKTLSAEMKALKSSLIPKGSRSSRIISSVKFLISRLSSKKIAWLLALRCSKSQKLNLARILLRPTNGDRRLLMLRRISII